MHTSNPHFQFFSQSIDSRFKTDTNNLVGRVRLYLVYPNVLIDPHAPSPNWLKVSVKQPGLKIKPDSYPFFKFIEEHPQVCQKLIESCPDLQKLYEAWRSQANPE